ncbi:hypothetical protein AGMMS49936_02810 [Endomicrobiia bacterium]|nr:hypothetical protein AGMMS49936_02810 [Endomicrobiia bacterium]
MKATKCLSKLAGKMVRNVLAIIAMFVCTSICLGGNTKILNSSNATHGRNVAANSDKANGTVNDAGIFPLDPRYNTLIIEEGAIVGDTSGARIDAGSFMSMTGNKVIVNGGDLMIGALGGAILSQKELLMLMIIQLKLMQERTHAGFMADGHQMEQLLAIKYL